MLLLIIYVLIALVISFLCSVAEAVILSVTPAHIALLELEKSSVGSLLRRLKEDINRPLAAILTLNTIAHTVGAAGVGAQAAVVFGNTYVGVASAVLTFLILIFSEIIPKTLGANYWRTLAPITAYSLRVITLVLFPFVRLSEIITSALAKGHTFRGFSRGEFAVMAELSAQEGQLGQQESKILKNLLSLRETSVRDAMTPRTVVFSLPDDMSIEEFYHKYEHIPFSRIPIYSGQDRQISGFVLRSDLLLAQAQGNTDKILKDFCREISVTMDVMPLSRVFDELLRKRSHIMLVVDEYGNMEGILTLEDVLETLLGLEIVDESDKTVDMQELARSLWKQRAKKMGIDISD